MLTCVDRRPLANLALPRATLPACRAQRMRPCRGVNAEIQSQFSQSRTGRGPRWLSGCGRWSASMGSHAIRVAGRVHDALGERVRRGVWCGLAFDDRWRAEHEWDDALDPG